MTTTPRWTVAPTPCARSFGGAGTTSAVADGCDCVRPSIVEHVCSTTEWSTRGKACKIGCCPRRRPKLPAAAGCTGPGGDRRVRVAEEGGGVASLWVLITAPEAVAEYESLTRLARTLGEDDPRGMDARRAHRLADLLTGRIELRDRPTSRAGRP